MGVFVKTFHFVPFYVHFWSKLTPKVTFSLKHAAFFTGRYHMGFKTKNVFWEYWQAHTKFCVRICIFSTQNGLRTPQFEIFSVWFRRHLRLKMPVTCGFYDLMWYWMGEGTILGGVMRWKLFFLFKIYKKLLLAFSIKNLTWLELAFYFHVSIPLKRQIYWNSKFNNNYVRRHIKWAPKYFFTSFRLPSWHPKMVKKSFLYFYHI